MSVAVASALSPLTSPAACHRGRSSGRYSLLFTSPPWRRLSRNVVCHCTSTLMTVRYMVHVGLMPRLRSRLQCRTVLTASPAGCVLIASNSITTRRTMWCASTRKLPQLPSHPLSVAARWRTCLSCQRCSRPECSSTMTSQRFVEPCHAALLRFASSVTSVYTSSTTASALWWCR